MAAQGFTYKILKIIDSKQDGPDSQRDTQINDTEQRTQK